MNIALWIVQGLLAFVFIMAGGMKAVAPIDQLAADMKWVEMFPPALVRFIGVADFLGGIGLVLPAATRIMPQLTGYAAIGLTLVMVLAVPTHIVAGEAMNLPVNFVLGSMAAFVAYGRLKAHPIEPR